MTNQADPACLGIIAGMAMHTVFWRRQGGLAFDIGQGIMTRKTYEKPILLRREKLSAIVAAIAVSGTSSA
ncbi:MAG: hypothetical protein J0I79_20835 [Mesorhizobium sp.]|uniref:hypothetical protein n=1 Tax=Mesorhizobium sp. TaxID=1871066 RepID=UPI001AC79BC3|nr:hypothetical protein [Mesorhizobium sp.]MBN9220401.1 hypothetical protein [Mesorhizobium sp.]